MTVEIPRKDLNDGWILIGNANDQATKDLHSCPILSEPLYALTTKKR